MIKSRPVWGGGFLLLWMCHLRNLECLRQQSAASPPPTPSVVIAAFSVMIMFFSHSMHSSSPSPFRTLCLCLPPHTFPSSHLPIELLPFSHLHFFVFISLRSLSLSVCKSRVFSLLSISPSGHPPLFFPIPQDPWLPPSGGAASLLLLTSGDGDQLLGGLGYVIGTLDDLLREELVVHGDGGGVRGRSLAALHLKP